MRRVSTLCFQEDVLSELDGCVLWGTQVVVAPQGRHLVIDELHDTHPGANRMKSLARSSSGHRWILEEHVYE